MLVSVWEIPWRPLAPAVGEVGALVAVSAEVVALFEVGTLAGTVSSRPPVAFDRLGELYRTLR